MIVIASTSFAVEPLSENDMGELSLDSGQNLLQMYGPTAAGLRIELESDVNDEQKTKQEEASNKTSIETADSTLKSIEEQLTEEFNKDRQDLNLDPNLNAIIKPIERIVGQATAFDTTSEIQYDKDKFKHEATFNADGTVQHDRDLQIDLLKFDRLGTDDLNDPSFGSLYISDWSSKGSTTTSCDGC
jgi:hypothetical protein